MSSLPRLNPVVSVLERGEVAFVSFAPPEVSNALTISDGGYDGVVFELEHNPYDIRVLKECFSAMLNRKAIAESGSIAPAVAPMVRIPPNGGEFNQWIAKQVLDLGAYGVIWPHVSTIEEAKNAVAACRYPRPAQAPYFEPAGIRGDSPRHAARYWGLSQQDYYRHADVWPLNPQGDIVVGIMCEEVKAVKNLPDILDQVPGIGVVIIGEGDLSQDLGVPRQYDHPSVLSAIDDVLAICKERNVACGHPHVDAKNVEKLVEQGFRWLMPGPQISHPGLTLGRKAAGRS